MSLVFSLGLSFRRPLPAAPLLLAPPVNTTLPVISGSAIVGQTLTASPGTWTNSPTGQQWQWQRDGSSIAGATGAGYTLQAADIGAVITVRVIVTNAGGTSAPAISAATAVVTAAGEALAFEVFYPFDTAAATIATQGATLAAVPPFIGAVGALEISGNGAGQTLVRRSGFVLPAGMAETDILVAATFTDGLMEWAGGKGKIGFGLGAPYNVTANYTPPVAGVTVGPGNGLGLGSKGLQWTSQQVGTFRIGSTPAGASLATVAPGTTALLNYDTAMDFNSGGKMKVGPIFRVTQTPKPCAVLTFDDVNAAQYTSAFPLMQSRNIPGTVYAPLDAMGTAGKFTVAQGLEMKAAGWAFCLDSGPQDEPVIHFGSVADAIAGLDAHAAALVAAGLSSVEDVRHICYSYGPTAYPGTFKPITFTANGTNTVAAATSTFGNAIAQGMVVRGTGLGFDPVVVRPSSVSQIVLDRNIPAGTYTNIRFCAIQQKMAVVSNGTTMLTGVATHGIVPGMVAVGAGIPAGTTVVSIYVDSASSTGALVLSANVTGCTQATFYLPDAEWLPGKFETAAVAAGYKTGRRTAGLGGVYTGFGIDPRNALCLSAFAWEGLTGAAAIANHEADLRNKCDIIGYHHWTNAAAAVPATLAHWTAFLDFLAARRDAGEIDVLTMPQWHERVSQRSFPA